MKLYLGVIVILLAAVFCIQAQTRNKNVQTLSDKVQQLVDWSAKRSVLKFNGNKFKEFIKSSPKNYSMIVMFTAMAPARQCVICKHAHDEFTIVANSFRYSPNYSSKIFFAMVDFDEGSDVFQMLRLNTAPVFMHFPAKGKPKGSDTMDIQRVGFYAESVAKWIQERTSIQIQIFRPPNYSGTVAFMLLVILIGGILYIKRNNLDFIYNKKIWGVLAVVFCLIMTSGQMWNHIRNPPFLHKGQNGGVGYIHGSSQGQLIVETYVVLLLNALIVVGMILLSESGQQVDMRKGRIMAVVGLFIVAVFFSLMLSIFRSKAQGYPYSFLFK